MTKAFKRRVEEAAKKAGWWHSDIRSFMNPPLWARNIASMICGGDDAEEIEAAYRFAARLLNVPIQKARKNG